MGRLIDADKAIECMQYYHDDCAKTSEYTRLGFETAIEVVNDAPTVEAISKADYETNMVSMLDKIRAEIDEISADYTNVTDKELLYKDRVLGIIDKYKAESEK